MTTAILTLPLALAYLFLSFYPTNRHTTERHVTLFVITALLSIFNLIDATGQTGLNIDLILTALWALSAGYHIAKI